MCSTAGGALSCASLLRVADVTAADLRQPGAGGPPSRAVGIEGLEFALDGRPTGAREAGDQLVLVELQQRVDPIPVQVDVAGEARQKPGPRQAGVAGAHVFHGATAASAIERCRRLSAVSTSAREISSRSPRSAIVRATRSTRWRPRALSMPVA